MSNKSEPFMMNNHFGVVGNPIEQSKSPLLHQSFGSQINFSLEYEKYLIQEKEFKAFVLNFFKRGGVGLNITVPFKVLAYEIAQANLTKRAEIAGAVNTLWVENNIIHGCNTDGIGLVNDIKRLKIDLSGKKVLLLGAGGASRGVIYPLLQENCAHIKISNRTANKAKTLCDFVQQTLPEYQDKVSWCGFEQLSDQWDIVINATSSSLYDEKLPLPDTLFAPNALAYDMLYGAKPTVFMEQAKALGAKHIEDGLGMLVFQGAESFMIWNNRVIDPIPVYRQLRQSLLNPQA